MKENENKKINDEKRIIEEETKKIKKLKLIVNIIMVLLIILIIVLFVYPGILLKNIKNSKNNHLAQNSINEFQKNNESQEDEEKETKFTDIAITINENKKTIIAKSKEDIWEELINIEKDVEVLGVFKNKMYYYDDKGISFIDLAKEEYESKELIKYKKYKISDNGKLENLNISKGVMIDNIIYFEYSLNAGGTLSTDGILSIDINSKSFDNAVQIISNAKSGNWQIDTKNKLIYYSKSDDNSEKSVYKYNIETKQNEKILENIEDFKLYENKILYYTLNKLATSTATGIYPATYDLYLYNIDNHERNLIYMSSISNVNSGNLEYFAEYHNNDVYYKDGNKIVQYNNGEKNVIYTYSSKHGGDYFYGFSFIDKNVIELVIQNGNKKYLVNGNVYDSLTGIEKTNFKLKDGTVKSYIVEKMIKI